MQRGEKSERSRRAVLDAALHLFSHQGFQGTTMREIAQRAGVSTGNVYHHFPDKDALFHALLDEWVRMVQSPQFPFSRVLQSAPQFPDNIEELGFAARDSVRQFRSYLSLVYIDMLEFGGKNVQQFYSDMAARFAELLAASSPMDRLQARLRPSLAPTHALLLTSRLLFSFFMVETLFGIRVPFEKSPVNDAVAELADIIRNGICARD